MALIQCEFFSEALGMCCSMNVILPQATQGQIGMKGKGANGKLKTLYLLHGMSDDHSIWLRRTSIERYVSELGIAVVMPAVGRSWYADQKHGGKYWTFVSSELPKIARSFFPLSIKREDNYVAGLSMGGYGAFKMALRCPQKFCAAASLSGVLGMAWRRKQMPTDKTVNDEFSWTFGGIDEFEGSKNDLNYLAEKLVASGKERPRLYQCCGTEDFLYEDNQEFRKFAKRIGLKVKYEEGPGVHEWGYWDMMIQRVLEWMF